MRKIILFFSLISFLSGYTQSAQKELQASRVAEAPVIDGKLDESVWKNADIAKDFVMLRPGDGDSEPEGQKTEVKIVYTDQAIY